MHFGHKEKDSKNPDDFQAPSEPPSYEQSQENQGQQQQQSHNYQAPPDFAPSGSHQYANLGPNEYPDEKKSSEPGSGGYNGPNSGPGDGAQYNGPNSGIGQTGIPPGTYVVPPQKANIAYDTEGTSTRPGYKEYLEQDKQRVAQGDVPKPRSFFGRKGAPLAPSKKGGSGGGFPGSSGTTYYNASK